MKAKKKAVQTYKNPVPESKAVSGKASSKYSRPRGVMRGVASARYTRTGAK